MKSSPSIKEMTCLLDDYNRYNNFYEGCLPVPDSYSSQEDLYTRLRRLGISTATQRTLFLEASTRSSSDCFFGMSYPAGKTICGSSHLTFYLSHVASASTVLLIDNFASGNKVLESLTNML